MHNVVDTVMRNGLIALAQSFTIFFCASEISLAHDMKYGEWELQLEMSRGFGDGPYLFRINSFGYLGILHPQPKSEERCILLDQPQIRQLNERLNLLFDSLDALDRVWMPRIRDIGEAKLDVWWLEIDRHEQFRMLLAPGLAESPPDFILDLINQIWGLRDVGESCPEDSLPDREWPRR